MINNTTNSVTSYKVDGDLVYLQFKNLEKYSDKLTHCFTTRIGGVSSGEFSTMNLGFSTKDSYDKIFKNYKILLQKLSININNIVFSKQVHGDNIRIVNEEELAVGFGRRDLSLEYDAMITKTRNACLVAFFADCVPVYFYDPVKNVAGIAHSGWKGTVKEISKNVIKRMINEFGVKVEDIEISIGPSIGSCCFEVGEEVYKEFIKKFPNEKYYNCYTINEQKKYKIDLRNIIEDNLNECGVDKRKIFVSNICTMCHNDVFYSYRAQNGETGRLIALMALK